MTVEWIHDFLDEIYRIDDFFKSKQLELINNFIVLQDKFRIRTEKYEVGSTKTGKSKASKASKKNVQTEESANKPLVRTSDQALLDQTRSPRSETRRTGGMTPARPGLIQRLSV